MFENVKQEIDDKIKTNGNNEITATRLNGILQDMMDAVAEAIGEQVGANPEGEATAGELTKLKVGDEIYSIPEGGGGGTSNYEDLTNKPSINGNTLEGNKTSAQLGLATSAQGEKVDAIIEGSGSGKQLFDKSQIHDGEVINTYGNFQPVPSWDYNICTGLISVQPNKVYCISGNNIIDGTNIRCLGEDITQPPMKVLAASAGTELSNYFRMPKPDGTGAANSMNQQFKTPAGAAYVQFNVAAGNVNAVNTTMLELVGDSYNPSFVPSPYEEYGAGVRVKESALPEEVKQAAVDAPKAIRRRFSVKILLVGSSHLMNTTAQLPYLGYKSGVDVEIGSVYYGAMSLQNEIGLIESQEASIPSNLITFKYFKDGSWATMQNKKFSEVYGYTDWDFIVIQRSAGDDQKWLTTQAEADADHSNEVNVNYRVDGAPALYMDHNKALQYILDFIRNNTQGNPTVLFSTGFADPSEGSGHNQTDANNATAAEMAAQFGLNVVPIATAVRNARNTFMRLLGSYENHLLCYDSQHLDYGIGCYVASAALWEYVCRKLGWSILNMDGYGTMAEVSTYWSGAADAGNYTEPTAETMMVAKACAMCACDSPDEPSDDLATRFKWAVTQNLAEGVTSSNTQGYCTDNDSFATTLSGGTTVTVTMGGVDITSTAYNAGEIRIDEVTGDVVITVE